MNIGKIIKKRRKVLNLSLKDIAKKLNVSESSISRYENEEIKSMRIGKLIPLSEILQVDIRELLLENYDKNYFHLSEEEKRLLSVPLQEVPFESPQFLFYENKEWILHFAKGGFRFCEPYGVSFHFKDKEPILIENLEDAEEI